MSTIYNEKLLFNYSDPIDRFLDAIVHITTDNLPEPHLPVLGANYGKNLPKVLFWGWETRNAKNLPLWVGKVRESKANAFTWFQDDFEALDFVYWRSNFNSDFWSFNLRILGKLHQLSDWRDLYRNPGKYEEILTSFAWANTDSIERFGVTAQGLGGCETSWNKLKEASKVFDSAKLIFSSLEPDIVVLVNWGLSEEWLLDDFIVIQKSELNEHLWHYEFEKPKIHLFWTPHPRGFISRGLDHDEMADLIISTYHKHIVN